MSEVRLVVDHLRLNYNGPFNAKDLFRHITAFLKERGWDLVIMKEFEQNLKNGKNMEWQIKCWKRLTDYVRYWPKVRILVFNYNKVDAVLDNKKIKIGNGKAVIYIDGFMELDESHRWEQFPFFQFLRTLYNNFFYKVYTERFEQRLTYDVYHLYHSLEQFFNMYKHYKVVSKVAPFASAH
jgi:uridine kinase